MLNNSLISIRKFHNKSQTELANALCVSKSYISEIESGKKKVTMNIIEKYSDYFDIPISSIMELYEIMDNKKKTPKHIKLITNLIGWIGQDEKTV
jgi:transcriptional regulator with XRE-family HTH domain